MRTVLVTGSDTGVGKTHVAGSLARILAAGGLKVEVVKPVETGRSATDPGDAGRAAAIGGGSVRGVTLASFPDALAPAAAASAAGREVSAAGLAATLQALPPCDWRIIEGAGGIASPIDSSSRDWTDFARAVEPDLVVIVVPDRVGAIGQGRMALNHAAGCAAPAGIWLNACSAAELAVHESNLDGLRAARVPLWATQAHGSLEPSLRDEFRSLLDALRAKPEAATAPEIDRGFSARADEFLRRRESDGTRRRLRVHAAGGPAMPAAAVLNLADNDYLELARDPALAAAAAEAARSEGTSSSASALITGWRACHEDLVQQLASWHGMRCGLVWSSGYAANSAVLGTLPVRADLVLADRLIHHSMIAGILRSGARLQRYEHLDLDHLEELLERAAGRTVCVATESVFSMDGDYPDLARMAALRRKHGFFWVVDEAHGVGWFGPGGAGLVRAAGVQADVDVLVGTFGKALASGGAYTLFNRETIRDHLVNAAGEFIYSTSLPPPAVAAASAAIGRARELAGRQREWQAASRDFRRRLRDQGWRTPDGDSPIVPAIVGAAEATTAMATRLRECGILAGAVRPPTVPAGSSRIRFSLKRSFSADDAGRVLQAMGSP